MMALDREETEEGSWTFREIIAEQLGCTVEQVRSRRYAGVPGASEEEDMGGVEYFFERS